jgi:hypothetical protein
MVYSLILLILVHNPQVLRGKITHWSKSKFQHAGDNFDALFILPDGPGSMLIHL